MLFKPRKERGIAHVSNILLTIFPPCFVKRAGKFVPSTRYDSFSAARLSRLSL